MRFFHEAIRSKKSFLFCVFIKFVQGVVGKTRTRKFSKDLNLNFLSKDPGIKKKLKVYMLNTDNLI